MNQFEILSSDYEVFFRIGDFDNFLVEIMVVGGCCVGGNNEKLIKKFNKLQFDCDVINDVTLMSHTSSESPWPKVLGQ